jgi:hypothetical protein
MRFHNLVRRFDGKIQGIHFLLQLAQRFCGLHQFCCKNSAGSVSRVQPTGAAVDRQRGRRLKFSSHDPSAVSVSTPVSAIDPSLIASSGAKPSRAGFFQTRQNASKNCGYSPSALVLTPAPACRVARHRRGDPLLCRPLCGAGTERSGRTRQMRHGQTDFTAVHTR